MDNHNFNRIIIYTDGACSGNPGIGGWAAIMMYKNHKKIISGSNSQTTNNRMELTAIIEAFRTIKKDIPITVYTDSKYVCDGITKWINNWKKNNWKKSDKKIIKNIDIWKELDEYINKYDTQWKWVKGHNGNIYNEEADKIACNEITKYKSQNYKNTL